MTITPQQPIEDLDEFQVYPRNQWYVAALSSEVGRTPIERMLLGESLVLYRGERGEVIALHNQCPHRYYPLSNGRVVGDTIQCSYHGLRFAPSGKCVEIPSQDNIPASACIKRYAVSEPYASRWVWVWMGDAGAADESLIPDHAWLGDPSYSTYYGYNLLNAPYFLVPENALDLTHVGYLHPSTLGAPGIVTSAVETEYTDTCSHVTRTIQGDRIPGLFEAVSGLTGLIDRWQDVWYYPPSFLRIESNWVEPGGQRRSPSAWGHWIFHFASPETPTRTRYYWAICRQYKPDDPAVDEAVRASMHQIIPEDVKALEEIHRLGAIPNPFFPHRLSIRADGPALHGRKLLERLIRAEGGATRLPRERRVGQGHDQEVTDEPRR